MSIPPGFSVKMCLSTTGLTSVKCSIKTEGTCQIILFLEVPIQENFLRKFLRREFRIFRVWRKSCVQRPQHSLCPQFYNQNLFLSDQENIPGTQPISSA